MSFWGEINCPICVTLYSILSSSNLPVKFSTMLIPFNKPSTKSIKRIGPHNKDVYSIIFGSLLGDGYAEKRAGGTRIQFAQENTHGAYALWLAQQLAERGYRSTQPVEISTRLGVGGKVRSLYRFRTYTFSSFNMFHEMFYCQKTLSLEPNTIAAGETINPNPKNRKIVPSLTDLSLYLTPLALAIWIMDDGTQSGKGLKLCTNCFTKTEVETLSSVLGDIYNLKATVSSAGVVNQYVIYISSHSMSLLKKIVEPHMVPSMRYKLGY